MTNTNILILKNFTTTHTCTKVALFDLDDTLIKYMPNSHINHIIHKNIHTKLNHLIQNNFFIAILSNQLDILTTLNRMDTFTKKVNNLLDTLKVPILFVAALNRDMFRKPGPLMLDIVKQYVPNIDLNKSFYCGDAAGRLTDHSDCDLKLAINMNMRFMTPEMFFDDAKKNFKVNYIRIDEYSNVDLDIDYNDEKYDMVFVYGKGKYSGKSFFVDKYLKKYVDKKMVRINCMDVTFIKKYKKPLCIYLDYDQNVLRWLKIFCELTGKRSKGGTRKDQFMKVRKMFKKVRKVKFCYDPSGYNEEEKKVAKLAL